MSKQRRTFIEEFKQEANKLTRQPGAGKAASPRVPEIVANLLAR
jgi:transposase-like protein